MKILSLMVTFCLIVLFSVMWQNRAQIRMESEICALETKMLELVATQDVDRNYYSKSSVNSDLKDIEGYLRLKYQIMPACFIGQKMPSE